MKKIKLCLMLLMLVWLPLEAQVADEEDFADVEELAETIKAQAPYYDAENHLSLVGVILNKEGRFLRVEYALEKGYQIKESEWFLDYFVHNDKWDVQPLLNHAFDLRILVKHPKMEDSPNQGASAFNYHPEDIQTAILLPLDEQARRFVASLAHRMNRQLPHATGQGETMVECRYDEKARVMTTVYEYAQGMWPEVRRYVMENMEMVRKDRAADLVMDTANHLAFVSYKGDVTLRHVYRDEHQTDSVEMLIAPWMWKSVFERGAASMTDPMEQLQSIADELNGQCPVRVDEQTTLEGCTLDTAARQLTYTYSLSATAMETFRSGGPGRQALAEAIRHSYVSGEGRRLASHLISAGVAVRYNYSSPQSQEPFDIILTVDELKTIVSTQN